jgi:hypothetical protein
MTEDGKLTGDPSAEHVAEMLARVRRRGHQLRHRRHWVSSITAALVVSSVALVSLAVVRQPSEPAAKSFQLVGPPPPCPEPSTPTPPGAVAWSPLYVPITHVGRYDVTTTTKDVPFFVEATSGGYWCITGGYAKLSGEPQSHTNGSEPGNGEIFPGPVSFEQTFHVTRFTGSPSFVFKPETLFGVNRTVPPVRVPNVVGKHMNDRPPGVRRQTKGAITLLLQRGLLNAENPTRPLSPSQSCDLIFGVVASQSPRPGAIVPAGTTVTLAIRPSSQPCGSKSPLVGPG